MLIDFDLATIPPFTETGNKERIGTVAFMACELLNKPDIKYGLHHDYESFFYCAIWHGLGYETSEKYPCEEGSTMDILHDWRVGHYGMMALFKYALDPGHKAFSLMRNKEFSRKCLRIWEAFDGALSMRRAEARRRVYARRIKELLVRSGDVPGSKITYPMLMGALGRDVRACGDECCI